MDWIERIQGIWRGGLVAVFEIFLLFLVIYLLFRFLRGSRGAAVLRGIFTVIGLIFGIVFLFASLFELEHITYIFEKLAALFFIALLIIFQPELRRGLLRLGLTGPFGHFVQASSPVLDEIVQAATAMSQRSVGALIAIQREVPMNAYVEAGTPMNSEVSSELLQTIFHPGSALHDGAVIVQGNRIAAAGCLLPLTENPELSKTMGTRHRAGIGLSEESDAVTVVVSEETGRISLGFDGKLKQGLSPDELRKELTRLCLETVEAGTAA
ncbi:MAG: diadenylate cyclase CdaA [Planctomycetota bacterium]|nr:diadenylate cyclase CdaA [Planctomycetota bacterium]